jgi:hypothetical protein
MKLDIKIALFHVQNSAHEKRADDQIMHSSIIQAVQRVQSVDRGESRSFGSF